MAVPGPTACSDGCSAWGGVLGPDPVGASLQLTGAHLPATADVRGGTASPASPRLRLACRAAPVQPSFTTALAPPAGGTHVHEAPRQAPTVSPSVQPVPAPAAGALAHLPHDPHPSSGERAQDGRHEQEDCQYPQQQSPDVHGCRGLSSNRTASGVREPARAELSPLSVPMPVASAWQGCGGGGWRPTIRR